MEETTEFRSQDHRLEGKLNPCSSSQGVVVAHPHPRYGGDMYNPVVDIIAQAYHETGWTTLRFNFRGTGGSEGRFDDGIGEQEDLQAAIVHLKSMGYDRIDLAGYSFGAWIIAQWSQIHQDHNHRIYLIAPPVAFLDFRTIDYIPGLKGVFTGSRDDIAPPDQIRPLMPAWQPDATLHLIPNADHFYWYHGENLKKAIKNAIIK